MVSQLKGDLELEFPCMIPSAFSAFQHLGGTSMFCNGGGFLSVFSSLNFVRKVILASLFVAIASVAVSTHLWTASESTGVVVDTVGLAFDVVMPVEVVLLGGVIGSGVEVTVEVDVMFDRCDAIIQWWG